MTWPLAAALGLALWGGVAAAGPLDLTADQMRAFGSEALARGYADQALAVAETLLQRDPDDSLALTLKAQALRVRGELDASEAAARAAWARADSDAARYGAATALAQALSLQDQRTSAQYWLRQAVQNAPNAGTRAQAVQDFNYVRAQNPLSLQITSAVQPSDNVNGGTRISSFDLGGVTFPVPGNLGALSGLTWSLGMHGSYKLAASPSGVTRLTFGATQQGVALSKDARALAPAARNDDYALTHLALGVERRSFSAAGQWTWTAEAARNWYAGAALSNSVEAGMALERPLGQGSVSYGATLARQVRLDRPQSSSTDLDLNAETTQDGPLGDQWTASLSLARTWSGDDRVDHAEAGLGLGWQARHPVAGVTLGANLGLKGAVYDGSGRKDGRWTAGLTASFDKASYLGFAPVLSVTVAQNNSNYLLYTTRTFGLGVSIRSRF